ncbi:MAG: squalene/phytoene synthase family protein, partial [Halanaerobiales bacterium]|nr:squalene/phytoene synthase family protein [Halanaerobiales bacterium]
CRNILPKVSRSFALTKPLIDSEIRKEVMVTYLIDRLLDSFEDEGEIEISTRKKYMDKVVSVFDPSTEVEKSLIEDIKKMAVYFDNSIRHLVKNIDKLASCFNTFDNNIKEISYRWLDEMKVGMKKYLDREVKTFNQLNEYCYYVAGTVGGFLTDLIIEKIKVSKKDKKILEKNFVESGLFLQKVNIIRDIKIDIINDKKH